MFPHDLVGMKAEAQGGTPARKAVRVEAPLKAKGLLTQTELAGGGDANQVGPTVRLKSWANQAVHTGKGQLHLPQDAPPNLTKSWSILAAPTVTGPPNALGLTFAPTLTPPGLAPNRGAFAHPDVSSKGAGSVPANQFGDESPSSLNPLSRKPQEWLENGNRELQPGRQSSPPQAGTEETASARRAQDDKRAEVETVMGEDYSPLRPPSPDSNAGLQGTRFTPSSDPLDGSEATLANTYSDPWQPTPEPKGRRPRLGFLNAIMKIAHFGDSSVPRTRMIPQHVAVLLHVDLPGRKSIVCHVAMLGNLVYRRRTGAYLRFAEAQLLGSNVKTSHCIRIDTFHRLARTDLPGQAMHRPSGYADLAGTRLPRRAGI